MLDSLLSILMISGTPFPSIALMRNDCADILCLCFVSKKSTSITSLVNCSVQLTPLPFYLDIGFIHTPPFPHLMLVAANLSYHVWCDLEYPTLNRGMVDTDASHLHQFFKFSVTDSKLQLRVNNE